MSGHPGFTINWSTKDARLLDWLDENPVEREIIFQKESIKGQKFSKRECTIKAAREIFSVDADIIIRRIAQKDPAHLRKKLADYFRHLKVKYQKFNKIIGPAASNSRYEDLEVGGETHRTIERLLTDSFPIWTRLHVYWRTLSHYNQYYSSSNSSQKARKPPPSSGVVPSKARTRWQTTTSKMRASKRLKHRGVSEEVIVVEDTPTPKDEQEDEHDDAQPSGSGSTVRQSNSRKRTQNELEEAPDVANVKTSGPSTILQTHELQMAEIQFKRQKLELEAQEKIRRIEIEAEERRRVLDDNRQREKERHELMMRYMALATGSGSKEDGAKIPGNT